MSSNELRLAYVESAKDVSNPGMPSKDGILMLTRSIDVFFISWTKADTTQTHLLNGIMQSPLAFADVWEPGEQFCIDCTKFESVELKQDSFVLTFHRRDGASTRSFCFVNLPSVSSFLEQLILNGIAVVNENRGYFLEFYSRCHRGVCPFCPSTIRLETAAYKDIDKLWDSLMDVNEKLILYLQEKNCFPKDPTFPLATAARTLNNRLIKRIRAEIPSSNAGKTKLLDENGEIIDKENFREFVCLNGVLKEELQALLPVILGVYDVNATKDEIRAKEELQKKEFESLYKQTKLVKPHQLAKNSKLAAAFRVITHDALRTDRTTKPFEKENGVGVTMLTDLLRTYVIFNTPVGYLQGMNDLFVPFIQLFFDDWNSDSSPIDKDGNVVDHTVFMPKMFWWFDALLVNLEHLDMLEDVTTTCRLIAAEAMEIISRMSPAVSIWLRNSNLHEMVWLYSDFVMLFRRSYEDIWDVWCALSCFDCPPKAVAYFVAAIIVLAFEMIVQLPDTSITCVMNEFTVFLETLSLHEIIHVARYFYRTCPLPASPQEPPRDVEFGNFAYFDPDFLR